MSLLFSGADRSDTGFFMGGVSDFDIYLQGRSSRLRSQKNEIYDPDG